MSAILKNQKEMVMSILQSKPGEALKPAQIAEIIQEKYPAYCEKKKQDSSQQNFNVLKQIANEISAHRNAWMSQYPELKCSEETPRTYWWEAAESNEEEVFSQEQTVCDVEESQKDEKDLYPKLGAYLVGMKSRKLYPKRINEKKSSNTKGKNGNKYLHPDLVALEDLMPLTDWSKKKTDWSSEMIEWSTKAGAPQAKLWSFEVKVRIDSTAEARENYLQTLANSAWANYSYLVATSFSDNALKELKTLHDLHGVGVIWLDSDNPADETIVKFPARERERVDWGTINRIASQNDDLKKFIELVADFHITRKTRDSDWDYPPLKAKDD